MYLPDLGYDIYSIIIFYPPLSLWGALWNFGEDLYYMTFLGWVPHTLQVTGIQYHTRTLASSPTATLGGN